MAQQAEHVLGKDEVTGSNPVNSSKNPVRVSEWDFTFFFFTLHSYTVFFHHKTS